MFFVLVRFLKRAPRIIIHLARNAEKGGGVLMSIILPSLKHSFISPIPVSVPDSGFLIFHTHEIKTPKPINRKSCARKHEEKKEKCPAWGKTCDKCGAKNHFLWFAIKKPAAAKEQETER